MRPDKALLTLLALAVPASAFAQTSGGPDAAGYTWAETPFTWDDLSAGATRITLDDDQVSAAVPIGFSFTYYGTAYTSVYVSSNGFVTFLAGQDDGCCEGRQMPNPVDPNGMIAGYWSDLYPPGTNARVWYRTLGTAPNRRFVVSWNGVPDCCPGNNVSTFQLVLFEARSDFEMRCQSCLGVGRLQTTGFENPAGTDGLTIRFGTYALANTAFHVRAPDAVGAGGPYTINEGGSTVLGPRCAGCVSYAWDLDGDGAYDDSTLERPTYSAAGVDGPAMRTVGVRMCTTASDCASYTAQVLILNVAPAITTRPSTTLVVMQPYTYSARATDPGGINDPLAWRLVSGPMGMVIDPVIGDVTWTPPMGLDRAAVTIEVSDGDGGVRQQSWTIEIANQGPDRFGYTWAPATYTFEDIGATGTVLPLLSDEISAAIPIGFSFPYYGTARTQAFISSEGLLALIPGQLEGCCNGERLPTGFDPFGIIAGYWSDLDPGAGGRVLYQTLGTAGSRRFIVQWSDVPLSGAAPAAGGSTFQIVLFEGRGDFEVRCLRCDGGDVGSAGGYSYSTGFQNDTGDDGLSIRYGSFAALMEAWHVFAPGPATITTAAVTPAGQPERASYSFAVDRPSTLTLDLFARVSSTCTTTLIARRSAISASALEGLWGGLTPGASYCWTITALANAMNTTRSGNFTVPALPTFTAGPTESASGQDTVVAATVSTAGTGRVRYAAGTCASQPSGILFGGSHQVVVPGNVLPRDRFAIEAWVRPTSANQSRTLFTAEGGNVRLSLVNGNLRFEVTTTGGAQAVTAASALTVDAYALVAASYDGAELRLWVDGATRGVQAATGAVRTFAFDATAPAPQPRVTIGGRSGAGFVGQITAMALYNRALTTTEVMAHAAAGPGAELPALSGRLASWTFDEGQGVQSVYDASGNGWSGTLGETGAAEADDPSRVPAFASSAAMTASGNNLSATLTGLTGPTYCYQVEVTTASGMIVSPLRELTRATDMTPPSVTVGATTVAECTGNASATLTLPPPTVMDDTDPSPVVRANVGSTAITFPYAFPLGDTVVRWTATDAAGNVGSANQTVRVRDTMAPSATGGAELVVEANAASGTTLNAAPASATDTCSAPIVTSDAPAVFPLGATTVTFTVRDTTGNQQVVRRDVRVVDTTPPAFDPALAALTVTHDGSACMAFDPPLPGIRDNGFAAERVAISVSGAPACWNTGTYTVTWTVRDPSGNQATGTQTINVVNRTLGVSVAGLEVRGNTAAPGRYHDAPVTVIFDVSGGTAPYSVTLTPAPSSISNTGARYRAVYTAPGAYPTVLITARDAGTNVGSAVAAFGVDTAGAELGGELVSQRGVTLGATSTYPVVFVGEDLDVRRLWARDGAGPTVPELGNALAFDRAGQIVVVPHSATLTPTAAISLAARVRVDRSTSPTLIYKATPDGAAAGYALSIDDRAQPHARMRIGAADVDLAGAPLASGRWHHLVATYDGRVVRLWADGLPAAQRLASGAIGAGTGPLWLGAQRTTAGTVVSSLEGQLADVGVWRAALDEERVLGAYRGGLGRQAPVTADAVLLVRFDGTGQTLADASAARNDGTLGTTSAAASDDPSRVALAPAIDRSASGLVRFTATITPAPSGTATTLVDLTRPASGAPLATGARQLGGETCAAAACASGMLSSEQLWGALGMREGAYLLEVAATDAAGNVTRATTAFRTRTYESQLMDAIARTDAMLMDPLNFIATNELQAARRGFQVALSYATQTRAYDPGSYLQADQGLEALIDARDLGVDTGDLPELVARATIADIRRYVVSLANGLADEDRAIHQDSTRYLLDARFENAARRFGQDTALARAAYEAVDLLYPPYRDMRALRRQAAALWNQGLADLAAGRITASQLRTDAARIMVIRQLMTATRNALRDTVYPEIGAALANPLTTERRSLEEIRDVIDRASGAADEVGDLIDVSNTSGGTACLDLLANLTLDDNTFTRCYIRINDMVRTLDTVSEPLVDTTRWRAGVALALFDMLELSMNVSPTGLPFAATRQPTPNHGIMLPDARAATVPGAIPASQVDTPARSIATAYAQYAQADALLRRGDVDAAFVLFRDNRCLLLRLFNEFYSTTYSIPSVADPKDPPIVPAEVGCSP